MVLNLRKAGVACGVMFASAAVALSTASPSVGASSALVIGGISAGTMSDVLMAPLLGGALKTQQRVNVAWPAQAGPMTGKNDLTLGASIRQGQTNLNTQITAALGRLAKDANGKYVTGEKVTVVGLSAGSLVVNEVLRTLAADANAPGKDQITFVVVADSSRQKLIDDARYNKKFDYTYQQAPETAYDVIVVTGEYDGMADFPDRWWNALAVANAVAGSLYVHVPVMYADLSKVPLKNIDVDVNTKGGSTTHYLVPTEKLPLVRMFPALAAQEAELKAKIDKGYSRNDAPTGALRSLVAAAPAVAAVTAAPVPARVAAPATSAAVVSAPTVVPAFAAVKPAKSRTIASPRVDTTEDDGADDNNKRSKLTDDESVTDDEGVAQAEDDADTTSESVEDASAATDSAQSNNTGSDTSTATDTASPDTSSPNTSSPDTASPNTESSDSPNSTE